MSRAVLKLARQASLVERLGGLGLLFKGGVGDVLDLIRSQRRPQDRQLRPLAQKVLGHRRLPAHQGDLAAVTGAYTRAFDLDLAAMEAELALGLPPTVPCLALGTAITRAA